MGRVANPYHAACKHTRPCQPAERDGRVLCVPMQGLVHDVDAFAAVRGCQYEDVVIETLKQVENIRMESIFATDFDHVHPRAAVTSEQTHIHT